MKRVLLATSLLAASVGTASAGTYVGLGIGTSPAISGDKTDNLDSSSRSAKVLLGTRMGNFSIEGAVAGNSLGQYNQAHSVFNPDYGDVYTLSGALKLNLPLGNNFEGFGRAGLQHTLLRTDVTDQDMSGSGFLIGGGFEYRLNLGVGAGSIFVDYQINKANLTGDENDKLKRDLVTRTWMLGLTVGI